jgi:hypothetical protein
MVDMSSERSLHSAGSVILTAVNFFWIVTSYRVVRASLLFRRTSQRFLHVDCFVGLHFDPEDGGKLLLRNLRQYLPDRTALHPTRQCRSGFVPVEDSQVSVSLPFSKGCVRLGPRKVDVLYWNCIVEMFSIGVA